jgi:hypothetical protein
MSHDRIKFIILVVLFAGIALCLYFFDPIKVKIYPKCPFRILTGYYCPGCGSTRALSKIVTGDYASAFKYNSLLAVVFPFLAVYFLNLFSRVFLRKDFFEGFIMPAYLIYILLAIFIIFGVLRNIPVYPMNLLAPH